MQTEWNELAAKFARIADRAGRPIDRGIMETVIVFNALGIHMVMSCEGHVDERRMCSPWIDIEHPGVKQMKSEVEQLNKDMELIAASVEVQQQKLAEYQEEMQLFTSYLKAIYFASRQPVAHAS